MSALFIELYLDEDVNVLIATLIRARGFSVITAREAGNLGLGDEEQLDYAVNHECALVTHNREHFEALARAYAASGRGHFGIILAIRRPPYELAQRLLQLIDQLTADEMHDQLLFL